MTDQNDHATLDIYERRESVVRSYCRAFPTQFTRAVGATLTDEDGRDYIDFLAGCSTLNYGHNHPGMKQALIDHIMDDGFAHGLDMHTRAKADFMDAFERHILKPRDLDYRMMFTGPTGTNAVEAALKLARKVTGRHNVISFTNGFHGMTLGALSCTGNAKKRRGAGISLCGSVSEPFDGYYDGSIDTADLLAQRLDDPSSGIDAPAAIIVEVVQGEGGLNVASDPWLKKIETLARAHGALFIIDDIQAGCGRTDGFFSFETAGVKPDMVTLAKSLSGFGLPFALTLIRTELDQWSPGEHNGTFRGNNHAFVTARKAIELYWQDDAFETEVRAKGDHMRRRLAEITAANAIALRTKGKGMMRGIEMTSGDIAGEVCAKCFENGLIIETSGGDDEVVKILCPLTISQAQLDAGLDILADAVARVAKRHARSAA
jgi:diaminobutyrate-2-oxoglutarate transaminase